MNRILRHAVAMTALATVAAPTFAESRSIPSVVVIAENGAPARGALQTPIWVGIHDGSFDIYDRGVPLGAGSLVDAEAVERLAEDGTTGPISAEFANALPGAPQATLVGPTGPLVSGGFSARTFNVNPETDQYFSYASMVIPSNDAFIANGNPVAHRLFNDSGRFVGANFAVPGTAVLDAGTEVNDEIAANTAFLNQAGPNIGVPESNPVELHEGFRTDGTFPDGVLTHPVFGAADFLAPNYRAAEFRFRYVDLGRTNRFTSFLRAQNEVTGPTVRSRARGLSVALSRGGEEVLIQVNTSGLSGPAVMAHLHNAQEGANGPIVANLTPDLINGQRLLSTISSADVVGPLADAADPMLALLNEMAAGNIYINIHTEAFPAGEIRGQVRLR
ncbi:MAG: spondin domain-containing protein [Pseudomonadota bacterium]